VGAEGFGNFNPTLGGSEAGYKFEFRNDGVYLTIYPNAADSLLFELSDMRQILKECGVIDYDVALLSRTLREANGEPQRVADPVEMSEEEIGRIKEAFIRAAVRAKEAGCDGVELYGAHGYLLHEFLSTYYNRRTDSYGGILENRARLLLDICAGIRRETGDGFPILVKINCNDLVPGITNEDYLRTGELLQEAGASAIEVSGAWKNNQSLHPYFLSETKELAERLQIPVILTGGIRDPLELEQILTDTKIAFAGLCRPFIVEPGLLKRWQGGNTARSWCRNCSACLTTKLVCPYW